MLPMLGPRVTVLSLEYFLDDIFVPERVPPHYKPRIGLSDSDMGSRPAVGHHSHSVGVN
jgi:hypothetical protein